MLSDIILEKFFAKLSNKGKKNNINGHLPKYLEFFKRIMFDKGDPIR